jgi:hypothetical protein
MIFLLGAVLEHQEDNNKRGERVDWFITVIW